MKQQMITLEPVNVVFVPWDDDNGIYSGSAHIFVQSGDELKH